MSEFGRTELWRANERIRSLVHQTPVLTSRSLDAKIGASLYFKCENFQRSGSFKIRGASHAIACLSDDQKARGVVAHSSGNFAQAVALAARNAGVSACIAMPSTAAQVKINATRAYGGEIIRCEPTSDDREYQARRLVQQRGATFLHPSNDINVILGQSTASIELFQEYPDLDSLFVPVGGGGLIAGSALAAHHFSDHCQILGGEPFAVDDAYRSLQSGKIESNQTTDTIADGLRTSLGDQNFPIIQKFVQRIIRVTEEEIVVAMRTIWERLKIVIEPSCAVAFAALEKEKHSFQGQRIGIILSGGNVDLDHLPFHRH